MKTVSGLGLKLFPELAGVEERRAVELFTQSIRAAPMSRGARIAFALWVLLVSVGAMSPSAGLTVTLSLIGGIPLAAFVVRDSKAYMREHVHAQQGVGRHDS